MTTTGNPCVTPNVCYEPAYCPTPCTTGYGAGGKGFLGSTLAFILVLFILLAIVGACWF